MRVDLTDSQIQALLNERKVLPADFQRKIGRRVSRLSHQRADVELKGVSGGRYCIMVRQSELNQLDFSAILGYYLPQTTSVFRLRRYNGRSHFHVNRIEGDSFRDFHIHMATERYQRLGAREDTYAQLTAGSPPWPRRFTALSSMVIASPQ
jgi:hypothetical protein